MDKKKKTTAPKTPAKRAPVDPKKKKGGELDEKDLKGVAGGLMRSKASCTCSNMPLDPG